MSTFHVFILDDEADEILDTAVEAGNERDAALLALAQCSDNLPKYEIFVEQS
jgi:hypothetical protein